MKVREASFTSGWMKRGKEVEDSIGDRAEPVAVWNL